MSAFFAVWLHDSWSVVEESGIWLLFGLSLAALLKCFIPTAAVERHLRAPGLGSILKASAAGVPLPLCSCSVIPVAVALRQKGAGRGAMASFLVSTPEIGVDSFLLSYGLLGPIVALLRTVAAFCSAVVVGLLVDRTSGGSMAVTEPAGAGHCGGSEEPRKSFIPTFIELLDDIAPTLLVGFVVSGVITALLPIDFFPSLGVGTFSLMLVMAVVSLPIYVCASASTPLAAALLARGLPVGAAIVFLLAGPATNFATIMIVRRELGLAAAIRYVGGILAVSMSVGLLADQYLSAELIRRGAAQMHEHSSPLTAAAGAILLLMLVMSVAQRFRTPEPKDCCH